MTVQPRQRIVYEAVAHDVAHGQLKTGDRLPSERALADEFGVSRDTVRRALASLVEDGLVTSLPGRGHYVDASRFGEPPNTLMSFTELARFLGLMPASRILVADIRPATFEEAAALRIIPGGDVFDLYRLRLLDDKPVALDRTRVPTKRVPGIDQVDFADKSLFSFLESHGMAPARSDFEISAAAADDEEAHWLGVEAGFRLLSVKDCALNHRGDPVYVGDTKYRSDVYRFRATFYRRSLTPQ
jgi:DNA-binding GntR family transcriptional regulator